MDRKILNEFYKGTDYTKEMLKVRGIAPRPREWNMPLFIKNIYKQSKEVFGKNINNGIITLNLDKEDILHFRAIVLHESLFGLYKGFYNYLSALRLYGGGAAHWIEVTSYYSKLYMAKSIINLAGTSSYIVDGDTPGYDKELYKLVNPNEYRRNLQRNNGKFLKEYSKYAIELDIKPEYKNGKLIIKKYTPKGSSHIDIWKKYSDNRIKELGFTKFTYSNQNVGNLSVERNKENYSFEGYNQLDFNLDFSNFKSYFNRGFVKEQTNMIYTSETAIVLGVFCELYNFYKDLNIRGLPIEKEKFSYMIDYMLDDDSQKSKLLNLCERDFPIKNEYIEELYEFYQK